MILMFVRIALDMHKKYIRFDSTYTKLVVFNLDLYNLSLACMIQMVGSSSIG